MINFSESFIYSDQPTTCPKCGVRTETIVDLFHSTEQFQIHKCPNEKCSFEFIMQYDIDFDNGSLL
jgi:hypothetical protein